MDGWITLWKVFFVAALTVFAGMSVWVVIWGARDIRRMFREIEEERTGK
jgi:hypothetical protein